MGSVGLDLARWVEVGLLRIWAVRSTEFGLDNHLAMVSGLVADHSPVVAVTDGIASLISGATRSEVMLMLARKFHLFKERGVTAMATASCRSSRQPSSGSRWITCPVAATPSRYGGGPRPPGLTRRRSTAAGMRSCRHRAHVRFLKQVLGWTRPKLRDPAAA